MSSLSCRIGGLGALTEYRSPGSVQTPVFGFFFTWMNQLNDHELVFQFMKQEVLIL